MKNIILLTIIIFKIPLILNAQNNEIDEKEFVDIGGIRQWVTIKGNDTGNPVVLFLHGGPGSVMSIYDEAIYGSWQKDYMLVNWDQRGAGRTFGENAPAEVDEDYWIENPLVVERMVDDGIELTQYLTKRLNKQKVFLVGTSWGSILGTKMALKRPDLFHAYIGHAQFVSFSKNIGYAYQKVYEMADYLKDSDSKEKITLLGKPPYDSAKDYGQLLRIVKKNERNNSVPAPETWWKLASEYDNETDSKNRYNGDDYSFLHFVGHKKLGIRSMVEGTDFIEDGFEFKVPVYFIQGREDILTSMKINKPYYDKIIAPAKEYFILDDAAHGHNKSVVDKQYQILRKIE